MPRCRAPRDYGIFNARAKEPPPFLLSVVTAAGETSLASGFRAWVQTNACECHVCARTDQRAHGPSSSLSSVTFGHRPLNGRGQVERPEVVACTARSMSSRTSAGPGASRRDANQTQAARGLAAVAAARGGGGGQVGRTRGRRAAAGAGGWGRWGGIASCGDDEGGRWRWRWREGGRSGAASRVSIVCWLRTYGEACGARHTPERADAWPAGCSTCCRGCRGDAGPAVHATGWEPTWRAGRVPARVAAGRAMGELDVPGSMWSGEAASGASLEAGSCRGLRRTI